MPAYDTAYWDALLKGPTGLEQAKAILDPGEFWHLDAVGTALGVAFSRRCAPLADHILDGWAGLLNLNHAPDNGASWVNREAQLYLRGEVGLSWLSRLLVGGAATYPDLSRTGLLGVMLERVDNCVRVGIASELDEMLPRLPPFVELVGKFGAGLGFKDRPAASVLARQMGACGVLMQPSYAPGWAEVVSSIEQAENTARHYPDIEKSLRQCMEAGLALDLALVSRFASVPLSCRTLSPFALLMEISPRPSRPVLRTILAGLVAGGLDPSAREANGQTPLISLCNDYGQTFAHGQSKEMLDFLLAQGVDVNLSEGVSTTVSQNATDHASQATPLHMISTNPSFPVERLLGAGAKVQMRDSQGLTPLLYACAENFHTLINDLLAHGASMQACPAGDTPLHKLFENMISPDATPTDEEDATRMVRTLVEFGAPLETLNAAGQTPAQVLCAAVHDATAAGVALRVLQEMHLLGAGLFAPDGAPGALRQVLATRPQVGVIAAWLDHHALSAQTTPCAFPSPARRM